MKKNAWIGAVQKIFACGMMLMVALMSAVSEDAEADMNATGEPSAMKKTVPPTVAKLAPATGACKPSTACEFCLLVAGKFREDQGVVCSVGSLLLCGLALPKSANGQQTCRAVALKGCGLATWLLLRTDEQQLCQKLTMCILDETTTPRPL